MTSKKLLYKNPLKRISINSIILLLIALLFLLFVFRDQTLDYRLNDALLGFSSGILFILYCIVKRRFSFSLFFSISYIGFLIWEFLATFFSRTISMSIWSILLPISYFLLVTLLFSILHETPRKIKELSTFLITLSSCLLFYDFISFIASGGLAHGEFLSGSFSWHNQFAGFLLFLIPLLIGRLLAVKNLLITFLISCVLVISLLSMTLTYSRGGWISLAISLVVIFILAFPKVKNRWRLFSILAVISIICMTFIARPQLISQKLQRLQKDFSASTQDVSTITRITVWKDGVHMLLESPFIGFGPGSFGSLLQVYESKPWLYSANAHNYFLEVTVEGGIPALIFFVLMLFSTVSGYIPIKKTTHNTINTSPELVGFIAAAIGSLSHTLIDVDWSRISLFLLFWLCIGVILAYGTQRIVVVKNTTTVRGVYLLTLCIVVCITLLIVSAANFSAAAKAKSLAEEIHDVDTAIRFNPFDGGYYYEQGLLAIDQKQWNDGYIAMKKSQLLNPYDSDVFYALGYITNEQNNQKKSIGYFTDAIKLSPYRNPIYYTQLATQLIKEKKMSDAKHLLEEAVYQRFPINENFKEYKYIYDYTDMAKNLRVSYLLLAGIYVASHQKSQALHLESLTNNL